MLVLCFYIRGNEQFLIWVDFFKQKKNRSVIYKHNYNLACRLEIQIKEKLRGEHRLNTVFTLYLSARDDVEWTITSSVISEF